MHYTVYALGRWYLDRFHNQMQGLISDSYARGRRAEKLFHLSHKTHQLLSSLPVFSILKQIEIIIFLGAANVEIGRESIF